MTVIGSMLNNTFTIWMPGRVSDGRGGWAVAYENAGTVKGRICPTSSKERVVADSEEQQITHVLYTETLTTSLDETFGRGALAILDDLQVEILGVREPSEAGHHWEIDVIERQDEIQLEVGS
jgi:head-tail adaptor